MLPPPPPLPPLPPFPPPADDTTKGSHRVFSNTTGLDSQLRILLARSRGNLSIELPPHAHIVLSAALGINEHFAATTSGDGAGVGNGGGGGVNVNGQPATVWPQLITQLTLISHGPGATIDAASATRARHAILTLNLTPTRTPTLAQLSSQTRT